MKGFIIHILVDCHRYPNKLGRNNGVLPYYIAKDMSLYNTHKEAYSGIGSCRQWQRYRSIPYITPEVEEKYAWISWDQGLRGLRGLRGMRGLSKSGYITTGTYTATVLFPLVLTMLQFYFHPQAF